jgi:DNA repair photolyase
MFYHGAMGSGVAYREITVKSALTRVQGMPFTWSLNPYYGCAHSCRYCYAREYHALRGRDTGSGFDREVEVKINFPDVLRRELSHLRLRETVALGTATDPYQPAEARYRITRRTLEVLVGSPLPLVIITKGTLIVRDIDLLVRLAHLADLRVCVSIGTVSAEIASTSEPDAPLPAARLEAVRRLRAAGIDAGVLCAPVLPGLSDTDASLEAVASAAAAHGAAFFRIRPLKLDPGVRPHYFGFLAEYFPALQPATTAHFADRVNPAKDYVAELNRRVERISAKYGFERGERPRARTIEPPREAAQLKLAI